MEIIKTTSSTIPEIIDQINNLRSSQETPGVAETVQEIIAQVKTEGDKFLMEITKRFDNAELQQLKVTNEEIKSAYQQVSPEVIEALKAAKQNIETFHKAHIAKETKCETQPGVNVWRVFRPIEAVGLYVPGGKAAYPSTVLMNAIPAKVAGCQQIIICTPPQPDATCNPAVLVAADICGITEIYKVGGAQAVAAMAYGTESIPAVSKICGPGNQYVTTAKIQVQNKVAIDMPAGPSEIMVIADKTANPEWVAADLLSQLEHAEDSQAILVTTNEDLANQVNEAIITQTNNAPRQEIIRESLKISRTIIAQDSSQVIEITNAYAPEHLEIITQENDYFLRKINNAGSIFLGPYTSEPLGDYATGANHTLPTTGFAKMYPPLSTESFGKWIQVQEVTEAGLYQLAPIVTTLAEQDGLPAHATAINIRLNNQIIKPIPPVQSRQAYTPPLSNRRSFEGLLLDFSERTAPPSPNVIKALKDFIENDSLTTYPEYQDLVPAIANYANVTPEQVLPTNGSDRGIDIIFRTFSSEGDQVIIPQPSFAIFTQSAGIIGNQIVKPYYSQDLSYPLAEVLAAITPATKIITICNPNNPPGTLTPVEDIEKIAQSAPNSIVYIDEAYSEFSGVTAVPLLNKYPNIIISRTFSKAFGIAAMRIGYLLASPELVIEMNKVRGPYEVNMPAAIAARAALADIESMTSYVDEVMNAAKPLTEEFFQVNSIKYFPSSSNYILFVPEKPAELNQYFIDNNIRIRPRSGPNIENTLRVSIGTVEQMKQFISVYQSYLNQQS